MPHPVGCLVREADMVVFEVGHFAMITIAQLIHFIAQTFIKQDGSLAHSVLNPFPRVVGNQGREGEGRKFWDG